MRKRAIALLVGFTVFGVMGPAAAAAQADDQDGGAQSFIDAGHIPITVPFGHVAHAGDGWYTGDFDSAGSPEDSAVDG